MGEVPGGGEDGENTAGLSNFTVPTPFSTGCSSLGAEITLQPGGLPMEHLLRAVRRNRPAPSRTVLRP
jgi:hypothetical protein